MFSNAFDYSFQKGISFIRKEQQQNGSFLSYSSPDRYNFGSALPLKSVFSTALITQSLIALNEKKLTDVLDHAIQFLLEQKSQNWTWNYWDRKSPEAKKHAYPDDLDDTFCALAAIYLYDPSLLTGDVLAKSIQVLTSLEVSEGGPYRTWLVSENADTIWKDVDLGVNANVAYFLKLQDVQLPKLKKLFANACEKHKYTTPYYPNPFAIYYFLSRVIQSKTTENILTHHLISATCNGALDIALKTLALIHCGVSDIMIEGVIKKIIPLQAKDGGWDASVFYTGVNPEKTSTFYAGSRALTTAYCLEAISAYLAISDESSGYLETTKIKQQGMKIHKQILKSVDKRISGLGKNTQKQIYHYLKLVLKNDKKMHITLLPYLFYTSLRKQKKKLPQNFLIQLGVASLYGWIAYTIYDNFLDEEAEIASLPLANVCLREMTVIFTTVLPKESGFAEIFMQVMDKLEEINVWEVTNCRYAIGTSFEQVKLPDYRDYQPLADRSMGHALGCVAILLALGYTKDSSEVKNILKFFSHYIIARQLNDDAHDWEQDLQNGQLTSVVVMILRKTYNDFEKVFWEEVNESVCVLISAHLTKARNLLKRNDALERAQMMQELLDDQEKFVIRTRAEKQKARAFLRVYSK